MTGVTIDVFIFQMFGMLLGTLPVKTVLQMVEYEAPAC